MTDLLGWVRADAPQSPIAKIALRRDGDIAEVFASGRISCERDRLEMMQLCYRKFAAFLPNGTSVDQEDLRSIPKALDDVAGFGQFRLHLDRSRDAPTSPARSGRAHLKQLCRHRARAEEWRRAAGRSIDVLARSLPVRDRRISLTDESLTLDLLLPSSFEPLLAERIGSAIKSADEMASLAGRLSASGLWAPLAFAGSVGDLHV